MLPYTDSKDAGNLVSNAGERAAYLFDLTRTKPASIASDDTYSVMEQIKNGYIVNTKYQTKVTLQPPAHVWVFANQPPRYAALSTDRWKVWTIAADNTLQPFNKAEYELWSDEQEINRKLNQLRQNKRQKRIDDRVAQLWAAEERL